MSNNDEDTVILQQKMTTLRNMEVQNLELKAQVMQTKRIISRLEEQQVKLHETQLNQMFQMQKNNDDLQQAMTSLQDENEILREYLADVDLDNKTFQQKFSASSMKINSQNHHSMFRNTSHVKVSDFN